MSYTPKQLLNKWFKEFRFFRYHCAIRKELSRWQQTINQFSHTPLSEHGRTRKTDGPTRTWQTTKT